MEQAVPLLRRALELDAKIPTAHLSLGAVYWQQNHQEAAIEQWRQKVAAHAESFQANYSLGAGLALGEGHRTEAEKSLKSTVFPGMRTGSLGSRPGIRQTPAPAWRWFWAYRNRWRR